MLQINETGVGLNSVVKENSLAYCLGLNIEIYKREMKAEASKHKHILIY